MKNYWLVLLLLLGPLAGAWAQAGGPGRLTGSVRDSASRQPVAFATVALLPATGSAPLDGSVADEQGRFSLRGLRPGSYRLQVSFVGYATRLRTVEVGSGLLDVGIVELAASQQRLGEVTVTGQRQLVDVQPDRLVYNAEQDPTNRGGVAADVLRKVPLLSVDLEGNLELRGSTNLRVLINNKPSSLFAGSVADALRQLPADQIASVEVITVPGAKYDGEGTAGIVNIILKKNNLQGLNGSLNAAAGNRGSSTSGSLNVRRGRLGLNSALSGNVYYAPNANELTRTNFAAGTGALFSVLRQTGSGRVLGGGGDGRLTLDYDPAPEHNLSVSLHGNLAGSGSNSAQVNDLRAYDSLASSNLFTRATDFGARHLSYDVSGTYTRSFADQKRREWSVLAQHARNRSELPYDLGQYDDRASAVGRPDYQETSSNVARNVETTLQTDDAHPFGERQTLEVGAKAILRRVLSEYAIDTLRDNSGFRRDAQRSNRFDYDQNVLAGYASYGFGLGRRLNARLGTRLERTDVLGRFRQQDETRFTSGYLSLLPNASLSYSRQPGRTLRLAYSRRIQRPQIFYLNPYENRVDRYNVSQGNPELDPELADSYELSYQSGLKSGGTLSLSLFSRQTNNAIEAVRRRNADTVRTSYANLARTSAYGGSVFGAFDFTKKWKISATTTLTYVVLRSGFLQTTNTGLIVNLNGNSSYMFTKKFGVQVFGGLNSSRVQLQGRAAAWSSYSLAFRKVIFKGQGDLIFNADNFLQARRDFRTELHTPLFDLDQHNYLALRGVRLSLAYRFGKLEAGPPRPRRSIRNDDAKAGDSGGQ